MNLIPWSTKRQDEEDYSPLGYIRSEFDQLFNRFDQMFGPMQAGSAGMRQWSPMLDVTETDKEILVKAEIPGIEPKDLDITISGNMLTLAGEKKEQSERKGENFFHSERRFGSFRRTVQLPASVDPDKMDASYKNGLVNIRFQKHPGAVPKRIKVQPAGK